jgi:hypothetical protein
MTQPNLDTLLASLRARHYRSIDVEQAVWTRLAEDARKHPIGPSTHGPKPFFQWRTAVLAVAIATSAGFLEATLTSPIGVVASQNGASWVLPDASLAPSTLLGV